jgi:predicted transposase YdaD
MLYDVLQESKAYQKIKQEGREEGRKEGELQALRQAFLDVVQGRFPKLLDLATKPISVVVDPAVLRDLIVKISLAQTVEEARQHLLAMGEDE